MAVPEWVGAVRRSQEDLLETYRTGLREQLDGLTEQEARLSLVPSRTTLLGLVQHVTYVERFYLDHAVSGRSLREIGVASTPDRSFVLRADATIASVLQAHHEACEHARVTLTGLALDDVVTGGGRERPVWALVQQVLRELAHHSGHADILREQVLARRDG